MIKPKIEETTSRKVCPRGERGLFYLLFLGVVLVLIMIIALGIEIGRLLVADRQLQNAADAASLAAVQLLHRCDLATAESPKSVPLNVSTPSVCPAGSRGGWQASKAAVVGVLKQYKILGQQIVNPVFNSVDTTFCDNTTVPGYGGELWKRSGSDSASGLTFTVTRIFECDTGTGKTQIEIDGGNIYPFPTPLSDCINNPPPAPTPVPPVPIPAPTPIPSTYPYCVANAVRVDLTFPIYMPLAKVFKVTGAQTMTATATSVLRLTSSPCSAPSCDLLGCFTCPAC